MTYAQRKARKEMKNIALITLGFAVACAGLLPFFFAAGKLIAGA